ncbi:MAG: adenylate/guanylate cyclase domain-containing protein [Thermoleophilaceae bacterium]
MIRRSFRRGELLLVTLGLLEQRPMSAGHVMAELDELFGDDYVVRAREVAVALDALAAEGLVERIGHCRRITREGATALAERGGAEVLQRLGHRVERVTLLFTDVVGSTRLFERVGDDVAHRLMRRHFSLLREAVQEHRGREVKSLGDGLMVAFESADDAVACAHAMQRAVAGCDDGLELRVGIASGEAVRERDDYFGRPVIVARRLCDSAGAGEVLVAGAEDQQAEPVRSLRLKGLAEPVAATVVPVALTA